jgi:hypothetical protein
MNIIVKPYGNELFYCRPDTTWERENRDFYSPECVNEIYCTPVAFARVCKAGKCVGAKFAGRYYDGVGCGILLYGASDNGMIPYIDKSSILPMPLYNPVVMEDAKEFEMVVNGESRTMTVCDIKDNLENTICRSSELMTLRVGDYVAVELEPMQLMCKREAGEIGISGKFCGNDIYSLKVIF